MQHAQHGASGASTSYLKANWPEKGMLPKSARQSVCCCVLGQIPCEGHLLCAWSLLARAQSEVAPLELGALGEVKELPPARVVGEVKIDNLHIRKGTLGK